MAKARIQVKLDSDEIRKLLKSTEVGTFLIGIGQEVASAAGGDYDVEADYNSRKSRVVVNVKDTSEGAMFREMSTGNLARAVSR
jgi:hypothetical protein